MIAHGLPPESVGGVEQHVDGLARALTDFGHRVTVYARSGDGAAQGTIREQPAGDGGRPFPVTHVTYRYEDIDSLAGLYRVPLLDDALRAFLARAPRFDVAHVHHLTGMSTGLVDVLREAGVPVVLTLHDYWLMCPRGQMWHRRGEPCARVEPRQCAECLTPTFGGWLPEGRRPATVAALHANAVAVLQSCSALVAPSARVRPQFAGLGGAAERIRVVENGVDTESLWTVPPPAPRPGEPLRVGYLGTLIPSKGLGVLVDAIQELPAGTASLDVWGNSVPYHGDETYLGRTLSRLRTGTEFRYHGPYQTADLPRILAQIDVVAAPALWAEAFGLTVREALAAARPVVVSRIGGLQDAIQDGAVGRVVEPGDPAALAEALRGLAADPQPAIRAAEAGRRQCRGFRGMAEELCQIYSELVSLDPG